VKLALMLGGTDEGRSGIGRYVREIAPRLLTLLERDGGSLSAIGTRREHAAYAEALDGSERVIVSSRWQSPGPNALWHLVASSSAAAAAGCDVALFPAANRRMALRSALPLVAVVHDLAQLRVKGKYDRARMTYVEHVLLPSLRRAHSLVAVSAATRADVEEHVTAHTDSTRVVPNGVDYERFVPKQLCCASIERARSHLELNGPYLLYLSRLELPAKNHLRLLEAFAASSARHTHTLLLAGADWGGRAAIEATVDRLDIRDRVRLLGFVDDELIPALVAGAEAVAMVGLFEGFGLPALEALSCGVPVVVSSTGALPEVVGTLGLLAEPTSTRAIRDALERAVGDEAHRRRVLVEGPSWARAHGWEASAAALLDTCRAARRAA
jgi:glycosyltransferase involved in cell wall biosynthesis